ncbi:hypothetical protein [Phaeovulum sp.]|nr:hypothetical protein [Phaeovulum sp.]MDP1668813.1 hypothetical protein [Phaeovulum sp.]MDZ4119334.1 hypothetical protein [Phaeovulum sp.]
MLTPAQMVFPFDVNILASGTDVEREAISHAILVYIVDAALAEPQ